jgi:SAM-dependent methyltransferase
MIMTTNTLRNPAVRSLEAAAQPVVFAQLAALADPIRSRVLLALEAQELSVRELQQVLQLPQSTVSRHLRLLGDEGWIRSRSSGATNWYRMAAGELPGSARQLWAVVREQARTAPAARRDAERARAVLAERQGRSREFFATSAGQWDRLRGELFGRTAVLGPLLGLARREWVVADLGCGTGDLAAALAPHVARVVAVDDSAAMLDGARARTAGLPNVELRAGALEALPLADASVDVAFAVLVLHHLADPAGALREAARVLRPGGRLVVVDMVPHERAEYRELMGHQWMGFDESQLAPWCRAAGLGEVAVRPLTPDPEAKGPTLFVLTAGRATTTSDAAPGAALTP